MENKLIEEYIEKGQELELLNKLNSYVIETFDDRCENLIKILIVIQEKARIDWMQPNQALVNIIIKVLPNILESNDGLESFTKLIEENAVAPYERISYLIRQFIIGIEDNDSQITNTGISSEKLNSFQKKMKGLNVHFLKAAIENGQDYLAIISLFYNCVDRLGEERKVFLIKDGIVAFRDYIFLNSKNYLTHFIRPYYTGPNKKSFEYFYHVPEPYYEQLFFSEGFSFKDFIKKANEQNIEVDLIQDANEMHERIQKSEKSNGDRILALFSKEMEELNVKNLERFLKLRSCEHVWVHKECLPPKYKEV